MMAPNTFQLNLNWEDDIQILQILGNLTEHAEPKWKKLFPEIRAKKLIVDLSHLQMVNSYGIALWCHFVAAITVDHDVSLIHCPRVFVDAANMVPGVVAGLKISSFTIPYYCPFCKHNHDLNVNHSPHMAAKQMAMMKVKCEKCQKDMKSDCDLDEYLTFLQPQ